MKPKLKKPMTTMKRLTTNFREAVNFKPFMTGSATATLVALNASAVSADVGERFGYGGHMWGSGTGWFYGGHALMFVFWIGVIVLIVLAVRWASDRKSGGNNESALNILKDRMARGEIEPAEYEERQKILEK